MKITIKNYQLQRAESVRDKLLGLGVDAARLEVVGHGKF